MKPFIVLGQEWSYRIDEYFFINNASIIELNGKRFILQYGILYESIVFAKTLKQM